MYSVFCQNCTFPQPASAFTRGHTVNVESFNKKEKTFFDFFSPMIEYIPPKPQVWNQFKLNVAYQSQRPGHYVILHYASLFNFLKDPSLMCLILKLEIRDYSPINILASGCSKGLLNFVDNHCVMKTKLNLLDNFEFLWFNIAQRFLIFLLNSLSIVCEIVGLFCCIVSD